MGDGNNGEEGGQAVGVALFVELEIWPISSENLSHSEANKIVEGMQKIP